jgi:hypothetical protein
METTELSAVDFQAFLAALERDRALSSFQVQRLLATWPTLRPDWASSPFFRNVGEHTRASIDELRSSLAPSSCFVVNPSQGDDPSWLV